MNRLSHIAADGSAQMVDVSAKPMSTRVATAVGKIRLRPETIELVSTNQMAKGNVLATARIAGIQAAKQTAQLIPLCHNIALSHVEVRIDAVTDGLEVQICANCSTDRSGNGSANRRISYLAYDLRHVQSCG